jgi:hypothetical protein
VRIITDTSLDASKELKQQGGKGALSDEERCDVLALRGLLACRILEHSLQMRHLVDYGVNRWGGQQQLGIRWHAMPVPR